MAYTKDQSPCMLLQVIVYCVNVYFDSYVTSSHNGRLYVHQDSHCDIEPWHRAVFVIF